MIYVDFAAVEVWASGRNGSVTVEHAFCCQHRCDMAVRNAWCYAHPQTYTANRYQTSSN